MTGCSDSDPGAESLTPQVTVEATDLDDALLEASDIGDLIGDVQAQPLDAVAVFENPDPRGPCGAPVPPVPTSGASGRAFESAVALVIQLVLPRTEEVDEFMAAQLANVVEPCGPYESTTNVGTVQEVSDIEAVELPELDGFAMTAEIDSGGAVAFAWAGAAQSEGAVTLLFGFAAAAAPVDVVQTLVERAAERL